MSAFDVWDELDRGGWQQLSQWRADQKPEGLHHDYKVANWTGKDISDDDKKNLAKNLSGFGNVDGGVLVFGAEGKVDASTKLEVLHQLKGVSPLDQYEERIRLLVKTSTVPPVPGVIVKKIEDPSRANHGIVIVYIPLTDAAPFRAQGPKPDVAEKYFMRSTSDTLVMPHQMLAAMFGRRPMPQLRVGIELAKEAPTLEVLVENVGRGAAIAPFVRVKINGQTPSMIFKRGSWEERTTDVKHAGWKLAFALPQGERIYPGEYRNAFAFNHSGDEREITVRVDCENGEPMEVTRRVRLQQGTPEWFEAPVT